MDNLQNTSQPSSPQVTNLAAANDVGQIASQAPVSPPADLVSDPVSAPSANPAPAQPGKNPLDVLEELLKNAQKDKSDQASSDSNIDLDTLDQARAVAEAANDAPLPADLSTLMTTPDAPASTEPSTEPPAPTEAEILAAIELKKKELKQADEQAAQIQIQAVRQEAVNSPQAKVRLSQDQQAEEQSTQEQQVADDYAIHQLSHTKV